jgi:phosphohistidine phosphatase SixA
MKANQVRKPHARTRRHIFSVCSVILICFSFSASGFAADNTSAIWEALAAGGYVALLRHALAPGTGDPPEFRLRDCSTQRNLSNEGRDQASRIGDRFRENGIHGARVFSSQWCRCLETARLLKLGKVAELAPLNSFFRQFERRALQTEALRQWLGEQELDRPIVLVTHQVNITALTGIYPDSGELVVIRQSGAGDIQVIGTIETR